MVQISTLITQLKILQVSFISGFADQIQGLYIRKMGNKQSSNPIKQNDFSKVTLKHKDNFLQYAVSHMKGWREYMQDASIHINNFPIKNHYLFGIFDGHGGAEIAQYVQKHFSLELYLNKKFQDKFYQQSLIETFNKMDFIMQTEIGKKETKDIIFHLIACQNRSSDFREDQWAGCTANVCYVTENQIVVANAGDSRCVASINGRAVALSFDHKPQDRTQVRRIKKAGGYVSGGRVNQNLNLSRSIGDLQYKKNKNLSAAEQMITSTPDVIKLKRQGVQFIIMGCDGIWQKKSNEQMVEWINQRISNHSLEQIVEQLLDQLIADNGNQYLGTDNMSAILIKFRS